MNLGLLRDSCPVELPCGGDKDYDKILKMDIGPINMFSPGTEKRKDWFWSSGDYIYFPWRKANDKNVP